MADGDANWALWQNPTTPLLAGLGGAARVYQNMQQENDLQSLAANPNDPTAQQAVMSRYPDLYSKITDAQTSRLKAQKALLDLKGDTDAAAKRAAYIKANAGLFGGQPDSPASATPSGSGGSVGLASLPTPSSITAPNSIPMPPAPSTAGALLSSGVANPAPVAPGYAAAALNGVDAPLAPYPPSAGAAGIASVGLPKPGNGPAASTTPGAAPPTTPPANPVNPNDPAGDIVVTGSRAPPAPTLADIASSDLDGATKLVQLQSHVASLNDAQRQALADKTNTWAVLGNQLSGVPYAQRQAIIDQNRDILHSHNISDAEINAFDPSDQNLRTEMGLAIGYKGILDQHDKDRQFTETQRDHNMTQASAAASRAVTMRGQNMTDARQREANTVAQTQTNQQSIEYWADSLRHGAPLPTFGNGRQAAAMRMAIADRAAQMDIADGKGGGDYAAAHASYAGVMAGQRTLGQRSANIEMAATEAGNVIPLARAASAAVSRNGFLPLARVQQALQNGSNDPNYRRFVTANNAVINTYARAISPTGAPHVADQEHARQMLSTAYDQPSYNAILDQMGSEISVARKAPGQVRATLNNSVTGRTASAPPTPGSVVKGFRFNGGNPSNPASWTKAQ